MSHRPFEINGFCHLKIAATPAWQVSDRFDDVERAMLAYTDALVHDGGRVADAVFERRSTSRSR